MSSWMLKMGRKIWSIIGLLISLVMLTPVNNALDDLHGHTTRAAFYLVIFIIGMAVAWTSVMSPVYKIPAAKEQKPVEIKVQKQEENKTKKSGMATTSFVLGLTSFIPGIGILTGFLAIMLGSISLNQINKNGLTGKGMAIAGIILGILGLLMFLITVFSYIYAAKGAV